MKVPRSLLLPSALCLLCAGSARAESTGDKMLRDAFQAQRTVALSATQYTNRDGAPSITAKIYREGGKRRVEYSAPAIMRGDILLDDGKNIWRYHRAENTALKTKIPPRRNAAQWRAATSGYATKVVGKSKATGQSATLIAVVKSGKTVRKFWIADKTKIILRSERFNENGHRIEASALANLHYGNVPDSKFKWSTPSGATVESAGTLYERLNGAQRAASWLRAPRKTPSGYAFESAVIDSAKGEVWLRYSNGTRRFSIFQQRVKDNKNTKPKTVSGGVFWQKNGSRFFLAGLPNSQALQVARSY